MMYDMCVCVQTMGEIPQIGCLSLNGENVVLKCSTSSNHQILEFPSFILKCVDQHWKTPSLYIEIYLVTSPTSSTRDGWCHVDLETCKTDMMGILTMEIQAIHHDTWLNSPQENNVLCGKT